MPQSKSTKAPATGEAAEKPASGRRTARTSLSWCVDHVPVTDWITWNRPMRVIAPVFLALLILIPVLEAVSGGMQALESLFTGGFLLTMLGLFLLVTLIVGLCLFLQGPDVLDILVDSKGIHLDVCLPRPNRIKLLARSRSPDLQPGADGMVLISHTDLAWSDIRRIQLWSDRNTVLFYRSLGFMTLAVPCTPFTYDPLIQMIRDKLGKRQQVRMPRTLRPAETLEKIHARDARQHAAREKKLEKRIQQKEKQKGKAKGRTKTTSSPKKTSTASRKTTTRSNTKAASPRPAISPEFLADIQRMNAEDEENARRQELREKQRKGS